MDNQIDTELLKKIVEYGTYAPSGDNGQPWRFEIKSNKISIFVVQDKDTSLYNAKQQASLVSAGAVVENIVVASKHYSLVPNVQLCSDESQDLVAEVGLQTSLTPIDDEMFPFIKERCSNRKSYFNKPVEEEKILILKKLAENDVKIDVVFDKLKVRSIAEAVSVNEKIVLENKSMHDFLFNHVTWTDQEDSLRKGFFVKTLELKGPQKLAFRLLKNWKVNSFLLNFGISKLVAKDNAKVYSSSGLVLSIGSNQLSKSNIIKIGMIMQRIWLKATQLGLSVQPMSGITLLFNSIKENKYKNALSFTHINDITSSYGRIISEMGTDSNILMLFRIGYSDQPTAKTRRHTPEVSINS